MARPKKGQPVKSDYIKSHPDLDPGALVAKAKAAGIAITPTLIRTVRAGKTGKKTAAKKAPAKATAKTTSAAKKKPPSATEAASPATTRPASASEPVKRPSPASDFIRSLPSSVPTLDVVAQGAAKGIKFSRALVHMVRGKMDGKTATKKAVVPGAKAGPKKKPGRPKKAAAPKKPAATKAKKATMSRSDFVRSLPNATPAKEVIAKAKEAGIEISETLVYGVRTFDKTRAKKRGKPAKAAPVAKTTAKSGKPGRKPGRPAKPSSTPAVSSTEVAFRKLVLDAGIENAKSWMAEIELKVAAIIAGS